MSRKQKETSAAETKIILHLRKEKNAYPEIGDIMQRSRFTIRGIIKRFQNSKELQSGKHTGRPRKLTAREEV